MLDVTFHHSPPRLPEAPRSWRTMVLTGIVLAHLAGLALIVMGYWITGLVIIVASHLIFFWDAALPGSRLFGPVLEHMETPRREVWLTIDDGPSDDTPAMLDALDEYDAKATFFVVGKRAARRPEALRAIRARGYGKGLRLIGWSARGFDSVESDSNKVVSRLLKRFAPGVILMVHEGCRHGASVATLRRLLEALDERGYRCVLPERYAGVEADVQPGSANY